MLLLTHCQHAADIDLEFIVVVDVVGAHKLTLPMGNRKLCKKQHIRGLETYLQTQKRLGSVQNGDHEFGDHRQTVSRGMSGQS